MDRRRRRIVRTLALALAISPLRLGHAQTYPTASLRYRSIGSWRDCRRRSTQTHSIPGPGARPTGHHRESARGQQHYRDSRRGEGDS